MNVEIIPAEEIDAESLVAIQKKAFKRLYDIYQDEGSPYLREADEIIKWFSRPNTYVYKIMADGVLCGGIAFCGIPDNPNELYLARVYILPEMQGKGIAVAAIKLCEAAFPDIKHWTLDFPVKEYANRRCYEKAGYVDTGKRLEQSDGAITLAVYERNI